MKPALAVDDLSLTIGGAKILDGISLSVAQNETLGIIGPNGAGKTSFFLICSLEFVRQLVAGYFSAKKRSRTCRLTNALDPELHGLFKLRVFLQISHFLRMCASAHRHL